MHWLAFVVPKWLSLGLIVVIFAIAYFYARKQGPVEVAATPDEATALLHETSNGAADDERAAQA
jgi:hypothetical protein